LAATLMLADFKVETNRQPFTVNVAGYTMACVCWLSDGRARLMVL